MHLISSFKNKRKSEILPEFWRKKTKVFMPLFSEYSSIIVFQSRGSLELDLELNQAIKIILNNISSPARIGTIKIN